MITVVIGKEIEKIKGDFESYLNGLNMVGEISYSQYSELYDEGTKQIQKAYELGKAELEKELEQAKKVQVVEHFEAYGQCRDSRRIASLEKENAELKDKLNNLASVAEVRLANWQKYEKENAEQKKKIENLQKYLDTQNCYRECAETWVKLTKTKELLKKLYDETRGYINDQGFDVKILAETEQFLKELEIDRESEK